MSKSLHNPIQKLFYSIFNIFKFATPFDYLLISFGVIFSILSGLLVPFMTYLLGKIFEAFTDKQIGIITKQVFNQKIISLLFQFSLLGVGSFIFISSKQICWMFTGERQSKNMKLIYFKSLLKMDIDYFESDTVTLGDLLTSVNKDAEDIKSVISEHIGYLIQDVVIIFSTLILAFTEHAILTLVILASTPLIFLVLTYSTRKASPLIVRERNIFIQAGNVLENALSNIKTIRAFNGEEKEEEKHFKYLQAANHVSAILAWTYGLRSGLIQFLILSLFVQGFWYGSTLVVYKKLGPGGVLSVLYSTMLGLSVIKNILPRLVSVEKAQIAICVLNELIEKAVLKDLIACRGVKLPKVVGNIEFSKVGFSYLSRPDTCILKNIDLYIPANKTTVFIGESGSGKSTIIQLIQRLYKPKQGFIMLDGIKFSKLNLSWLRQQIGVVNQETVLFNDSIFANVAYGRADYWNTTIKEVEDACKLACIHYFITDLPEGYNTLLGFMGKNLSGGQRQKIAIARALIKDPTILILDEATNALDLTSEHMILQALKKCRKDRTTIVITHQLKNIDESDLVYILHNGAIVEFGMKSKLSYIKESYFNKLSAILKTNLIRKHEFAHANKQLKRRKRVTLSSNRHLGNLLSHDNHGFQSSSVKSYLESWNFEEYLDTAFSNEINDSTFEISNEFIDDEVTDVIVTNSDKLKEEEYKFTIFKLIMNTMENKLLYSFGFIASIINGFVMPLFSFVLANLLSTYSIVDKEELVNESRKFALIVLLIAAMNGLSSHFKYYFLERASEKWAVHLRHLGFSKILRQPQSWFDKAENDTGKLATILTTDTESLKFLIGNFADNIVLGIISLLGGIVWAFIIGWHLTLVSFGLVPILLIASVLQGGILKKYEKIQKLANEEVANTFYQTITSLNTVFSLTIESAMYNKFRITLDYPFKIGVRKAFICGITTGILDCLSFLTKALTFWYGAKLVSEGIYDLQRMLIVWTLIIFCSTSASQMLSIIPYYAKSKQAVNTINKIINLPIISDTRGVTPDKVFGKIKFVDVKFLYPERPEIYILDGLNLSILEGQTVAIVGKSGTGKSTVAALLQRIYEPTSGSITLDGEYLNNLQLRWLREKIGVVSQETNLFNMTIAKNIAYGKDNATQEEIENVARHVNLHDFICNLTNGYDTNLGSNGSQLSGGQRQRIAIARVLLRNPKILILDEATSALDTSNEAIVQETLNRVQKGRTTLLITHNLKSVKDSDKIILIENGKILESGTHNELMNKRGGYFDLIRCDK